MGWEWAKKMEREEEKAACLKIPSNEFYLFR